MKNWWYWNGRAVMISVLIIAVIGVFGVAIFWADAKYAQDWDYGHATVVSVNGSVTRCMIPGDKGGELYVNATNPFPGVTPGSEVAVDRVGTYSGDGGWTIEGIVSSPLSADDGTN